VSLTVGWLDNGNTRGEFTASIAKLCAFEAAQGRLVSVARIQSGPLMTEGRNRLVAAMLNSPAEWLLMVDTDMGFSHDAAARLLSVADADTHAVVGGLCFGVNEEHGQFPTLYRSVQGQPAVIFDYKRNGLQDVDATGAAFLLTHRSVFERYRRDEFDPWFHRRFVLGTERHPGGWLGEDISWCFHLRDKGVPILVDTRVKIGHVKSTMVTEHETD